MPAITPAVVPLPLQFEHPDGDERDALRDAVGRSADGAGDVRAVPVAVVRDAAVDGVEAADCPAAELGVA